jgi:type II secretory pathway pseudopilin PulG
MRSKSKSRRIEQSGQYTLIGLIVAMAIIVILGAVLYPKFVNPGGVTKSDANQYSSAEQKAEGVACGEYYSQIKMAIRSYRDSHGQLPPDLKSLSSEGVSSDMWNDPSCGFTYNPVTGELNDTDHPAPAAAPSPAAASVGTPGNPTPGTPGYPPPGAAPAAQPGGQPDTDIYSRAAHAAGGGDASGDLPGGN